MIYPAAVDFKAGDITLFIPQHHEVVHPPVIRVKVITAGQFQL